MNRTLVSLNTDYTNLSVYQGMSNLGFNVITVYDGIDYGISNTTSTCLNDRYDGITTAKYNQTLRMLYGKYCSYSFNSSRLGDAYIL